MIPRIALAVFLCALGCTNVTELADWAGDAGGQETDTDVGDIIDMDCGDCPAVGGEVSNLLCALDLCEGSYVLAGGGADDYVAVTDYRSGVPQSCTLDDTREAIARFGYSNNDLDPKLNESYAIMTTGDWDAPLHMTSCSPIAEEDIGTDGYETDDNLGAHDDVMYDAVEWRLELRAPSDAKSFSFSYVFFSIEYDDFISSAANDKFYAEIEAASTNDGKPTVINFTACRDQDAYFDFECTPEIASKQGCTQGVKYCYIAINSALSECCWYDGCPDGTADTSIAGTDYECAASELEETSEHGSSTGWLSTRWPIGGGEKFTLTFHIHDTLDSTRDSAVILDAFQFHRSFWSGTVVIE